MLLMGLGGLQAEALAGPVPPLVWPMDWVTPEVAFDELREHLLGRIWLGTLRGTRPLTSVKQVQAFLASLWTLRDLAEAEELDLVEMNPVALDGAGEPRPLDGVGRRCLATHLKEPPPSDFLAMLLHPRRVALAGVSLAEGGVGRTILGNLRRCETLSGNLLLLKPGQEHFLGLPCLNGVADLLLEPVDLLILALPAEATVEAVEALIAQGGGASVVGLVAGGIGDGADTQGLGARLQAELQEAREIGRWSPALVGPNFLGHWVATSELDTSFIPVEKLAAPSPEGGPVALLSQSGAYLLSRRSQNPYLPLGFALALGNQLDVALPDVLEGLERHPEFRVLGLYVEGFGPGQLERSAQSGRRLRQQGRTLLLYRAGRTEAGQAAASTHTGAMAGNGEFEDALLRRAGFCLAPSQQVFDAGLTWLGAHPSLGPGSVAVITNAGFESVTAADLLAPPFAPAELDSAATDRLRVLLESEGLGALVTPRLPLDLTPMASEAAFLKAVAVLLESAASIVVVGLVPFTRRLQTGFQEAAPLARSLAALALEHRKALGIVVDAGPEYEPFRQALALAGLPVFTRMEDALAGLQALA
jgi:acyl-CoA synthetase (NDP forming)